MFSKWPFKVPLEFFCSPPSPPPPPAPSPPTTTRHPCKLYHTHSVGMGIFWNCAVIIKSPICELTQIIKMNVINVPWMVSTGSSDHWSPRGTLFQFRHKYLDQGRMCRGP